MMDQQTIEAYLQKAQESLAAAESELASHRYNSCANRCYYACFQAAIAALLIAGIGPRTPGGQWGHEYIQAAFVGQLINRRKVYPNSLSDILSQNRALRQTADYQPTFVTQKQAERSVRRTRDFVQAIRREGSAQQ